MVTYKAITHSLVTCNHIKSICLVCERPWNRQCQLTYQHLHLLWYRPIPFEVSVVYVRLSFLSSDLVILVYMKWSQ